jgi:hypothetical protein
MIRNQYTNHTVVNSTIPYAIEEVFNSGTKNSTIASPLDIQYRNWFYWRSDYVDNNNRSAFGTFRPLQTFTLDDKYQIIEGLVVDAKNGGIGFRNHTIPVGLNLGAQWTEDLLWLQPESACTPTNLSLHFSISDSHFFEDVNGYLRDDGGFAKISPIPPQPRWDRSGWRNISMTPNLKARADVTAWWNNQLVAEAMNITESYAGSKFPGLKAYALLSSTTSLKVTDMDGGFLDQSVWHINGTVYRAFTNYGEYVRSENSSALIGSRSPMFRL